MRALSRAVLGVRSEDEKVFRVGDVAARGELAHELLVDARLEFEVKLVERLHGWEVGDLEKTHLAIGLGRAAIETGHTVLFVSATTLLAALRRAEAEGQLDAKLLYYSKRKRLVMTSSATCRSRSALRISSSSSWPRRYEKGSMLITTNQVVTQWGAVFGDDVLP